MILFVVMIFLMTHFLVFEYLLDILPHISRYGRLSARVESVMAALLPPNLALDV